MSNTSNSRLESISYRKLSIICISASVVILCLTALGAIESDRLIPLFGLFLTNAFAPFIPQKQFIQHFIAAASMLISALLIYQLWPKQEILDANIKPLLSLTLLSIIITCDNLKLIKNP